MQTHFKLQSRHTSNLCIQMTGSALYPTLNLALKSSWSFLGDELWKRKSFVSLETGILLKSCRTKEEGAGDGITESVMFHLFYFVSYEF